ncbi:MULTISPECIES: hypothetical protein [Halocynthiibacter]|uniref:Uncharacterized protein n=1 Tax=Halocynthiibacter halioticoli TaxID=2986804 RepID=A0AAE3J1P4_9RHOB|nr:MULTISPECIES: hypothetical protein [Halocynthiibacter]MCV6826044.1 hypothetical protein [Halocynthiibacter halioticoli]MCW4059045.1 hypothetical protein [Halocynthiibacter sp. SDUM655004]
MFKRRDKKNAPARVAVYYDAFTAPPRYRYYRKKQILYWLGFRLALWVLHAPENAPRKYTSFRSGLLCPIETVKVKRLRVSDEDKIKKGLADIRRVNADLRDKLTEAKEEIAELRKSIQEGSDD